MDDQNIHEWVEGKLEEGVSKERLKEAVKNAGKDPSVVDEVAETSDDPFQDSDVRPEPEDDDLFESEKDGSKESVKQDIKRAQDNTEGSFNDPESEDSNQGDSEKSSSKTRLGHVKRKVSSFSVPRLSARKLLIPVIAVLIIGGGYMFYTSGSTSGDISNGVSGAVENFRQPSVAPEHKGCPDVGVLISSITSSDGVTHAEVNVARGEARVVLEVFEDGEKIGESRATIEGENSIEVDAVGDRAVFRPVDCESYSSEKTY